MGRIPILLMVRELTQGGCERDLTRLALGFRDSPFEPHVACFRPGGMRYDEIRSGGVPVADIGIASLRSIGAMTGARRLADYVRRNHIQLLHAMDVPAACVAPPICRLAGVRAILVCQLSYRSMCTPLERRLLWISDRIADRVVSNSQAVLDDLTGRYGVPRGKTTLIYNGVELDRFHPPPRGGRDRSPLPEDFRSAPMVIGAVCALRPEKRLDTLLRAFAGLKPAESGVRLAIVGSGAMGEPWQALASSLGVTPYVHFQPSTPHPETWMRALDVFVLTSEIEAFPNSLLESMASGCAPIGSRVGGVPEMLGAEGMMFPAGDDAALASLLDRLRKEPRLLETHGAKFARRAAELFSLERNLRRTAEVYTETLAEKGIRV